ncbi:WG repeat-containing protein [Sinomicrobium soli]|uniref:WG repeat-containing protein n=1 Tax=Sinomicrobium sp. N-1-3-6 TaxID=2219864 RepID=UPI000DCED52D|nr:WG repeat-containing protein [Sinomicrobium sp. N-1-3-6]RAV28911.1 WG repeat-containing protein [Sinomicrobium sp. N-1-3-6]
MKRFVIWALLLWGISPYAQHISDITKIGRCSEGLISVEKDGKWGFVDTEGTLVINFRDDIVAKENSPFYSEGLCRISEVRNGIVFYGYMDRTGQTVIPAQFLNATPFHNGFAIAIVTSKNIRGKNEYLNMDIVVNEFDEVVINTQGEIVTYLRELKGILLSGKRYEQPRIASEMLSNHLVAIKNEDGKWSIHKI